MKNLYLIRHGKTEANFEKKYCGQVDLPLCDKGKELIMEFKQYYQNIDVNNSIFITSGMKRCDQTLKLFFGNVKIHHVSALKEMNFGIFEMHTYEQLKHNPFYMYWLEDTYNRKVPEGESGKMQEQRVVKAIYRIIKKYDNYDGDIVIVCHGGTIAYIINELVDTDLHIYEIQPQPGCGYKVKRGQRGYIAELIGPLDKYRQFIIENNHM